MSYERKYLPAFIKENEITNRYTNYEVRIYLYKTSGFGIDDQLIEEITEQFDTLKESLEYFKNEFRLKGLDANDYYFWLTQQNWIENKDGESDIDSIQIIQYLTNDIERIDNEYLTTYNHYE